MKRSLDSVAKQKARQRCRALVIVER